MNNGQQSQLVRLGADTNSVLSPSGLRQRAHNPSDLGSNPSGTTKCPSSSVGRALC